MGNNFLDIQYYITSKAWSSQELFGKYGEIEDVSVPFDKVKRQPRGYAFVKFKKELRQKY